MFVVCCLACVIVCCLLCIVVCAVCCGLVVGSRLSSFVVGCRLSVVCYML